MLGSPAGVLLTDLREKVGNKHVDEVNAAATYIQRWAVSHLLNELDFVYLEYTTIIIVPGVNRP